MTEGIAMLQLIAWMSLGWLVLCVPSTFFMVRLFRIGQLPTGPSHLLARSGGPSTVRPAAPVPAPRGTIASWPRTTPAWN